MTLDKNFGRFKIFRFQLNLVFDIGAQVGLFSKNLSTLYPECNFILFEPNTNCNQELEKNKFEFYNWLLYEEPGKQVKFYIYKFDPVSTGNSIYIEQTKYFDKNNFVILETKTLDQFSKSNLVDLIKLDVQGAEINVLKGAINTLKKTKFVLVETSLKNYNLDSPLEGDVIKFMDSNGFKDYILFDKHIWNSDDLIHIELKKGECFQNDLLFINSKNNLFERFKFKLLKYYIKIKS